MVSDRPDAATGKEAAPHQPAAPAAAAVTDQTAGLPVDFWHGAIADFQKKFFSAAARPPRAPTKSLKKKLMIAVTLDAREDPADARLLEAAHVGAAADVDADVGAAVLVMRMLGFLQLQQQGRG